METYQRPSLEGLVFYDDSGNAIPYGDRYWRADNDPPEDSYGHCLHPERFNPVEDIGRALIDFLTNRYDVHRIDSVVDGRQVIDVTPSNDGAHLSLTLPLPGLPGVELHAGWRFEGRWPDCGCDACDDSVRDLLDELEDTVLTIAEGGMSEWRSGPDRALPLITDDAGNAIGDSHVPWQTHVRFDGRLQTESGGWSSDEPEPIELPQDPFRWPAWPLRA